MAGQYIVKSAFQSVLDEFDGSGRRPVVFDIIEGGGLARTKAITVRTVAGDPYERIIDHELDVLPDPLPAETSSYDPDEVPF